MQEFWLKLCSLLLTLMLVINMLPLNVWAEQTDTRTTVETTQTKAEPTQTEVLGEVIENRTQFTKDYRLSSGMYVSAVYSEPIHFEKEGQWEEIDNTLLARDDGTYGNTAGIWDVRFPQFLTDDREVTITKDGYTLSFGMAGELRIQGGLEVADMDASVVPTITETAIVNVGGTAQTFTVSDAQVASAQVLATDNLPEMDSIQHEEMILTKTISGLMYNNVYGSTDIQYDLQSNKVKESVILESYDANLRGFRYNLDVGESVPVLNEDNSIDFYDADEENIVMTMPSPFLIDDAKATSNDVHVSLTGSGSSYTLIYLLPVNWLAEEGRSWPVILDPVVTADPNALKNVRDRTVASVGSYAVDTEYVVCGRAQNSGINRTFVMYNYLPTLSSSDVILSASLHMYKYSGSGSGAIPIEAHKVNQEWDVATISWSLQNQTGYWSDKVEDYQMVDATGFYSWNITDVVREWYSTENTGLMLKAPNSVENSSSVNYRQFYSANTGYEISMPTLTIMYRNNNGLESYWNYTSASAGRAGTGNINSYTGNLVWVRSIMGFGGNRMPVSISHVYNLNDNTTNDFGMGYGWRTNFNQRLYQWEENDEYYIWEDADGTEHYFRETGVNTNTYKDEDGLELTLETHVAGEYPSTITDKKGNVSYFDINGRLAKQENNQETKSAIKIHYTTAANANASPVYYLIDYIEDGVNRKYDFTYNSSNQLIRIEYKGTDSVVDFTTQFQYTNGNLTSITDNDGKSSTYAYNQDRALTSASDIDGYKLTYEYYERATPTFADEAIWQPYRVKSVAESHGTANGGTLTLEYAHNQTTFKDHNDNVEIMQFNDYGNAVSIQDGLGRAQYMQFAINNEKEKEEVDAAVEADQNSDEKAKKPNQLRLASKMQNTVSNILTDTSFETGCHWGTNSTAIVVSQTSEKAYMGSKSMLISSGTGAGTYTGAYSEVFTVASGETATFSAYVNTAVSGTRLALHHNNGVDFYNYTSSPLSSSSSWVRAEVSFTNTTGQTQNVSAYVFVPGSGETYVDCVQVEKMPAASRYNMVQNGDFRSTNTFWTGSDGSVVSAGTSAVPHLNNQAYKMTGSMTATRRLSQTIQVSGSAGDAFVLAGWAKGDSVPLPEAEEGENQRQFAIIGRFYNGNTAVGEEVIVQFNPDTNSGDAWQYAAQPMIAESTFNKITITLAYDYNANDVFFDGIQLFKEEFGSIYHYDNNGNVDSVSNEEGETAQYEYDENNNLTKETLPTGIIINYEYNNFHNVTRATSSDGRTETYAYDTWGNVASHTVTDGTITSSTTYTYANSGNTLATVTDAAGEATIYTYDAQTNLLASVKYPKDSDSTKTEYEYEDLMYRTTEVKSTTDTGKVMSANYTYTNDLLASIATPSSTYSFGYGNFGLRTSVTVGTKTLATYGHTDDRNNYLQSLAYGNSDSVQYTYDNYGRLTEQRYYENGSTTVDSRVTYQYDNDGALASVFDSATGLTTKYYYDFTGRTGATELRNNADLVFRISATYDEHNRITTQTRQYASGSYTDSYTYNQNGTLQGMVLGNIRGIGYDYDGLRRIIAMNTGDINNTTDPNAFAPNGRRFTYRNFVDADSGAHVTTNQITKIHYHELVKKRGYPSFDFDYTYDDNGNILTYTSPVESISYEYDTQNQLLRANNTGSGMDFSYTYDAAGNILTATKGTTTYSYTYGNSDWGDLLTAYNGTSISYDNIGNPLSYYNGWNFTWKQGREMAAATKGSQSLSFTYDADGIRKTKTVNGVVHTYYYVGGKLAKETYGSNVLDFFYDQNGHPFMLVYNGTVYYYITNAQGDVIRLTDVKGQTAARYQYDPYGNIIDSAGSHVDINPLRYRGYYYDKESGLYYLQSRYYDPNVGRFINADALTTTGQGLLGNNMLAYCLNNPCLYTDPHGEKGFVGLGLQFDVSAGHGTYGVAAVIYWDPDVVSNTTGCDTGNAVIAMYTYSGMAISPNELAIAPQLYEMTASLNFEEMNNSSQDELLITAMGLMTSLDLSGSVFLVYGYDSFTSANSYSGEFQTWAASVSKPGSFISGGLYYSYSDTCWAVGAKVSGSTQPQISPINLQYSRTYYSDPTIIMGW